MVQDMRDSEYYYSYLIEKPLTPSSKVIPLKYGLTPLDDETIEKLENGDYHTVMDGREPINCISQRYRSSWVEDWSKSGQTGKNFTLMAPINH